MPTCEYCGCPEGLHNALCIHSFHGRLITHLNAMAGVDDDEDQECDCGACHECADRAAGSYQENPDE